MNVLETAELQQLNTYLSFYKLKVGDFFSADHRATLRNATACLTYAKENLLTVDEMRNRNLEDFAERLNQSQNSLPNFFYLLIQASTKNISLDSASKILDFVDSFARPNLLVSLKDSVDTGVWERLFAKNWTGCDSCSFYASEFLHAFSDSDKNLIQSSFGKKNSEFYKNLPEEITIYRGSVIADDITANISWTLDPAIAEKFAKIAHSLINFDIKDLRYLLGLRHHLNELMEMNPTHAAVLKTTVPKSMVAYTNSRGESEVILLQDIPMSQIEITPLS